MSLTPEEIESLRIAIAEECGWKYSPECEFKGSCGCGFVWENGSDFSRSGPPPYTTSLDDIQAAAMERFKGESDMMWFGLHLTEQTRPTFWQWQLSALDWCIAFARTAKIWKYKQT